MFTAPLATNSPLCDSIRMMFCLMIPHFLAALKACATYVAYTQSFPTFPNFVYFCSHNW